MTEFRIQHDANPRGLRNQLAQHADRTLPASGYRLQQAEQLMTEMGYTRCADGEWRLPDEAAGNAI